MSEKFYQWIIYSLLLITAIFSLFLIASDSVSPFTTQATVTKSVTQIASEVSGVINHIYVDNGQYVTKGSVLFSIDPTPYRLMLAQANSKLQAALQSQQTKAQELNMAHIILKEKQLIWKNTQRSFIRIQALHQDKLISQSQFDDAAQQAKLAKQAMEIAQNNIEKLQMEYAFNGQNANTAMAKASVSQASLAVNNTKVIAKTDGIITNLQLTIGSYLNKGAPAMLMTNPQSEWISADFNERGLSELKDGANALVVFDAYPGRVFNATLSSKDDAVYDPSNLLGKLSTVVNNNRWIREHQKVRTRLALLKETNQTEDQTLISGSKASVMILPTQGIWHYVAQGWMWVLSYLRFIY